MPDLGHHLSNSGNSTDRAEEAKLDTRYIVGKRYRIIKEIAIGGFGTTYLAEDLESVQRLLCVVKKLQVRFSGNSAWQENVKRRFANEAIVQQRLGNHPQIPKLFDYFEENQQFYLVQEFIDGEELKSEVKRQPLTEIQTIALLQDVLDILDFVHKTNVIHRDIKPSNLIRRKLDSKFVLIDFGAVKELSTLVLDSQEQRTCTQMVGTQGYMSPEQMAGKPTFASDIYALGRTAIYALTGRSPLELENQSTGESLNWRQECQVSQELAAILDKMCNPRYSQRYHSVAEVLEDLEVLFALDRIVGERYRIIRYLGGKLGRRVFLAENLQQPYQSPCVIKQIQPTTEAYVNWREAERRFYIELQILQQLGFHEQIPSIWDSFETNKQFYLVQEFIDGENLSQKLEKSKRLSEEEVIQLLDDTLAILAFIHQYQFIHRHIKPSNLILRNSDRKFVLIGFDMVKDLTESTSATTETRGYGHSERIEVYVPPEQIVNRPVFNSDLYALGITAIQALTGVEPEQIVDLQLEAFFRQTGVTVNPRLTVILQKMIYLDCSRRYQSATMVHNDLQNLVKRKQTISSSPLKQEKNLGGRANLSIEIIRELNWQDWLKPKYILSAFLGISVALVCVEIFYPIARPLYYNFVGKQLLQDSPETALSNFQQVIDLKPNSSKAWQNRGDTLFQLERFTDALAAYDRAIALNEDNAEAWKGRGEALYRVERFDASIIAYDKVLKLNANHAETLNRKGRALYKLGLHDRALAAQEEALKINPNSAPAWSDKGVALMGLGKYEEALDAFDRAHLITPLEPRFWQDKALVLTYLNRPQEALRVYKEALDAYEQATSDRPKDLTIWLDRASVLSQLQRHQEALFNYEQILKFKPKSYLGWLGKGNTLFTLRRYPEALTAFDEALKIMPKSYLTWHNRGSLLQDGLKDLKGAIASYDKAIEINPSFFNAWRDRGFALSQLNQHQKAIDSFQSALAINPNDYKSLVGKGIALASLNRGTEALAAFDRATQIQPKDLFVWMNRGAVAEKWENRAQACESYQKASEINPTFPPAAQAIARLRCK
jgi:serine/threonine protein kinase/predicted TPR repeat methyltransferase